MYTLNRRRVLRGRNWVCICTLNGFLVLEELVPKDKSFIIRCVSGGGGGGGGGAVGYIFIRVTKFFTTTSHSYEIFFDPPPSLQIGNKKYIPTDLHTHTILPILCPSDLNQNCMKQRIFIYFNYSLSFTVC